MQCVLQTFVQNKQNPYISPKSNKNRSFFHRRFIPTSLVEITRETFLLKMQTKEQIYSEQIAGDCIGGFCLFCLFFFNETLKLSNSSGYTDKTLKLQNKLHLTRSEGHFLEGRLSPCCFFLY